jgi:ubiquinone/menaquinone biosynthesis C-methylase UbiE
MDAGVSLNFDRVADQYDESRGGAVRGERIAADLVSWLAPGAVLEVGVGTGIVAAALRARGVPVYGMDLSAGMLRRAVDRLGRVVVRVDALALPIASGSVDNVLFVAALHAIGDVPGAVAEAARVLRPGGRLIAVHGVPQRVPADDDVARALVPLTGLRDFRSDTVAALDEAAADWSLEPVATAWVAHASFADTPNAVADSIERRLWSYLWYVNELTWEAVVAPVVAALRALPEPNRPRQYDLSSRLVVFARGDAVARER